MQETKTKKAITEQFYSDVRKEYFMWCDKKENGIRIYTDDFIISKVAIKFYRSPRTILNIIYSRV